MQFESNSAQEKQESPSQIKPFSCILAYCRANMGIGFKGQLPWPMIRKDMKHFADTTSCPNSLTFSPTEQLLQQSGLLFNSALRKTLGEGESGGAEKIERMNAVVMGRKTWESIP